MSRAAAGIRRRSAGTGLARIAAVAAVAVASVAAAQPGQTGATDDDLRRLVALLDAPQHAVRHDATLALKIDERFTLTRLEAELRKADLTPEQRQRLLDVHKARFERTPRAAMGVQFDFALPQRVVIERTHEPFHCSKVLRPGDMITAADGVRLHGMDAAATMRSIILSHDPGDEVPLEVRRGAERLDVTIRLGRWNDFGGNARGAPVETDVRIAWVVRTARALAGVNAPGGEPISTGLTAAQWAEMETAAQVRRGQHQSAIVRAGNAGVHAPRLLLAGGRPRNDMLDEFERERPELNGKDEFNAIQWQRMRQQSEIRPRGGIPESAEQEIKRLQDQALRLQREIEQAVARQGEGGGEPQPPAPGREAVLAELQRDLLQIQQLLEAVRADAADAERR